MKVIIAGSRTIEDKRVFLDAIHSAHSEGIEITEVVEGGAQGVDRMARGWAILTGRTLKTFNADWKRYGKKAGPLRNQEMADYAQALIAIWDGKSRGTADMIKRAESSGLKVYVHRIKG